MDSTEAEDEDRCICGAVVAPHWSSERSTASAARVERGSCTSCGLQLVRAPGELWRHIRG